MNVSVEEIKQLRKQTGAGMMDCKKALTTSKSNVEEAVVLLRKQGLAGIIKRSAKPALEGMVGHYIHAGSKLGVLIEVNCETDFVARGEDFQTFVRNVAIHIAAANPRWITREEVPSDIFDRETEIILSSLSNKPSHVIEKIVEGRMNKFYKETCLMDQLFIRDSNFTITDLLGDLASKVGEKILVKKFARFVTGEE